MLPPIVRPVRVPTLVRDDAVTPEFRVEPVRVLAAAVTVISAEPLNDVPLIVLAVARVVAVDALPVRAPTKVVEVTEERPAIVVAVAPRATEVLPMVTASVLRAVLTDAEPFPIKILPLEYDKAPAEVAAEWEPSVALSNRLVFKSMPTKNFLAIYSPSMTDTHSLCLVLTMLL
jgi:hypothetical protein